MACLLTALTVPAINEEIDVMLRVIFSAIILLLPFEALAIPTDRNDVADVPTQWQECKISAVRAGNTITTKLHQYQSNTGWTATIPTGLQAQNVWHTIDLSNGSQWHYTDTLTGIVDTTSFQPNLPDDVGYVDVAGMGIITNYDNAQCEARAAYRAFGSTLATPALPQMQLLAANGVGGIRSSAGGLRIQVVDKKIQFSWVAVGNCATSFHITIQGYGAACEAPGVMIDR